MLQTLLAYFGALVILSSAGYMIMTRSYGTPFKNAVKKYPKLLKIKNASRKKRSEAFCHALTASAFILGAYAAYKYYY